MSITTPTNSLLVTVPQAAQLLSCCTRSVYALSAAGKIRLLKQGRSTRIARSEIERYVAGLGSAAAEKEARP